ncbi:Hsp70 family protein [Curtobacterium sp. MCPF17_046]|uniref:Hsp70 family protein n=1 Tax=Curtobacterium sp. MCPF17_046 TaxID=2175663 RepID=UPI0021ACE09A|nr:Hsp70 family protein [Curtobacterium sp. MCPF17_046]
MRARPCLQAVTDRAADERRRSPVDLPLRYPVQGAKVDTPDKFSIRSFRSIDPRTSVSSSIERKGGSMGRAVGIDLGTTNSAVAVLRVTGSPEVLPNDQGSTTTPSVVLFQSFGGEDEPLVGELAKRQAAAYPDDIVQYVKRFMGDPNWRFDSATAQYRSEEVSAIILKRLKEDAERELGEAVTDAVITVPAYFDDARRTATRQAGKIAGFNVLRVLNEPTAAALSYGLDTQQEGTVLVYDLGGGTFDVTVLTIAGADFEVLATDGDRNLGGFDWDNALMNLVADDLARQGVKGILDDLAAVADLREKAEFAKKALTNLSNTKIQLSFNGGHHRVEVSRAQFEAATASLLRRTEELVEDVLAEAGLAWNQIDHVLLVGGSTRMPAVRELVQKLSGKPVALDVNPDEAVALGAAVQAALEAQASGGAVDSDSASLAPTLFGGERVSIADVTSQALGVIMLDDDHNEVNSVVIPRNTKIPGKGSKGGETVTDNQTELRIRVTQGDDADPDFVTIVGEATLRIPPYPAGAPIEISYQYDIDQTIAIEVTDLTANASLGTFEVDRLANLDDDAVDAAAAKIAAISIN